MFCLLGRSLWPATIWALSGIAPTSAGCGTPSCTGCLTARWGARHAAPGGPHGSLRGAATTWPPMPPRSEP
eukprot:1507579-Lingulodinium_polyedra.AAC.1